MRLPFSYQLTILPTIRYSKSTKGSSDRISAADESSFR